MFNSEYVAPAPFGVARCKCRLQMNNNKNVKCFGERYHTIHTFGIHAGFLKEGNKVRIVRWKTEIVT